MLLSQIKCLPTIKLMIFMMSIVDLVWFPNDLNNRVEYHDIYYLHAVLVGGSFARTLVNDDHINDLEIIPPRSFVSQLWNKPTLRWYIKPLSWHYLSQAPCGYKRCNVNLKLHLLRLSRRWSLCSCAEHSAWPLLCESSSRSFLVVACSISAC